RTTCRSRRSPRSNHQPRSQSTRCQGCRRPSDRSMSGDSMPRAARGYPSGGSMELIGIRLGLGASRLAIVRQLVTEGLVLGAVSGAIGVLLSAWLMDSLRLLLPFVEYPIVLPTTIRGQEVAFAVGASIAASLLFALVPAIRASGTEIVAAMNIGR